MDHDVGNAARPGSPEMPTRPSATGRLQLLGEIARGGIGLVLKGRDTGLGRDLAVKVLLDRHGDDPAAVCRFIEEARSQASSRYAGSSRSMSGAALRAKARGQEP